MPFDGRNFKTETKPDVFSLEGLIAWLETQPRDKEYAFWSFPENISAAFEHNECGCLLHQYLTAAGKTGARRLY